MSPDPWTEAESHKEIDPLALATVFSLGAILALIIALITFGVEVFARGTMTVIVVLFWVVLGSSAIGFFRNCRRHGQRWL